MDGCDARQTEWWSVCERWYAPAARREVIVVSSGTKRLHVWQKGGNSLPRTQRNFLADSGDCTQRESNLRGNGSELDDNKTATLLPPETCNVFNGLSGGAELGNCTTCTLLSCEHRRSCVYSSEGMQYVGVNSFFSVAGGRMVTRCVHCLENLARTCLEEKARLICKQLFKDVFVRVFYDGSVTFFWKMDDGVREKE